MTSPMSGGRIRRRKSARGLGARLAQRVLVEHPRELAAASSLEELEASLDVPIARARGSYRAQVSSEHGHLFDSELREALHQALRSRETHRNRPIAPVVYERPEDELVPGTGDGYRTATEAVRVPRRETPKPRPEPEAGPPDSGPPLSPRTQKRLDRQFGWAFLIVYASAVVGAVVWSLVHYGLTLEGLKAGGLVVLILTITVGWVPIVHLRPQWLDRS